MAGMTLAEAAAHLTSTNPLFTLTEADVQGRRLPVFANAPSTLRDLQEHGRRVRDYDDFIVYEGERVSYEDWVDQTNRLSRLLTDRLGVRPGDRVAVAMRNYPEYLLVMFLK